jgi:hypothetical protein
VQQIIDSCNLVVLVIIKALLGIVSLKAKLLKHFNDTRLYRNNILTNDQSLVLANRLIYLEPLVLSNISRSISLIRVSIKDTLHYIFTRR